MFNVNDPKTHKVLFRKDIIFEKFLCWDHYQQQLQELSKRKKNSMVILINMNLSTYMHTSNAIVDYDVDNDHSITCDQP